MGFLNLFVVALVPVLKTLLITAVGLILALEKVNLLGDTARQHVNKIVFFVFTPSLVSSSLADTITMSSLKKLWFMPVNILLTFIIGSALGWILIKITRAPKHLHGLVLGCCAAGNLGNLLLIIIPAVCEESNSPFGDSSNCSTKGEAYAALSMAIGAVFIWTYVYNIIRAYAIRVIDSRTSVHYSEQGAEIVPESNTEPLLSHNNSHDEIYQSQDDALPLVQTDDNEKIPLRKKIKQQLKTLVARMNLKVLLAPSTIAAVIGLVIGATTPLRKVFTGDDAPLRVIYSSAHMLGEAAIPTLTLILGANLLKGLKKSEVSVWIIIGIQIVRYIILPLLGILVVKGAHHIGLVGSDSLYQFVLLLQYSLPSAMAIGTMTQLFEVGQSDYAVIMLWNYAVAAVALTLWTTFYMWLVS